MSERKVEITSLKLKLGKTEATLTINEAKKLKKALEEMFGVREVIREIDKSYPIYIETHPWRPYWRYPEYTWCSNDNNTILEYKEDNKQLCCSIQ